MKILFLTNGLSYGGVGKNVAFLANNISKRGHSVYVATFGADEYESKLKQLIDSEVNLIYLTKYPNGILRHVYRVWNLVKLIHKEQIEVVIGFTLFPNFYASFLSKISHIKAIITERGNPYAIGPLGKRDKIMFSFIRRADGAVFQSKGASEFYSKRLQERCAIIPNYIENKDNIFVNKGISEREKTIVAIGRLQNTPKRFDLLIEAFKIVKEKYPLYKLKIYGNGPDEEYLKGIIDRLNLKKDISFMGVVKNPVSKITDDAIYVITSDSEGIPNSLLESMSIGMPVVSTDCEPGGARMLIQDHVNGLLVRKGSAQAIANGIIEYIENPELADACGKEARKVLQRFAPDRILDSWINYINLLSTK